VRPFDTPSGRLRAAIVDRLEGEEEMGGAPATRVSSADGRWAYTLYARRGEVPFIHALDSAGRQAFCVDLPLRLGYDRQWALRLKLDERRTRLSASLGAARVATVDTRTWKVSVARR
jgi:hypothetical protein